MDGGKSDVLSSANGPSTAALQQRCHRTSASARSVLAAAGSHRLAGEEQKFRYHVNCNHAVLVSNLNVVLLACARAFYRARTCVFERLFV